MTTPITPPFNNLTLQATAYQTNTQQLFNEPVFELNEAFRVTRWLWDILGLDSFVTLLAGVVIFLVVLMAAFVALTMSFYFIRIFYRLRVRAFGLFSGGFYYSVLPKPSVRQSVLPQSDVRPSVLPKSSVVRYSLTGSDNTQQNDAVPIPQSAGQRQGWKIIAVGRAVKRLGQHAFRRR